MKTQPKPDPREDMYYHLPAWLQPLLTGITGKVASKQIMTFQWKWWNRLMLSLLWLIFAVAISIWLIQQEAVAWLLLLPITWLVTTSQLQKLQTNFAHHGAHSALSGNTWWDTLISEGLSLLVFYRPFSEYKSDHALHHGFLGLTQDVDLKTLSDFGFFPGQSKQYYWSHMWKCLFSPFFHMRWLSYRLCVNLIAASPLRKTLAWLYIGLLILLGYQVGFGILMLAWIIPVTVLFQASLLLQLLTEHTWVHSGEKGRPAIAALTPDRYFGEPLPKGGLLNWVTWWGRLFLVHLPARLFIAPGDLANHAFHHRKPNARLDWPNAAFARRDDALDNHKGWPAYHEHWGARNMLNATFEALSALPSNAILGKPDTY